MVSYYKAAMIILLVVVYVLRQLGFMSNPKRPPKANTVHPKKDDGDPNELKHEKSTFDDTNEETKDQKKNLSFKELKRISTRKQKKGFGGDPTHKAFLQSFKSKSSVEDFSTISTASWLFILVAESESAVTVHAMRL